ncbi:dipeptide epimerase [Halosegnis marinus]|uniref:Dipeptide epimerase n=1 Tax=Halosegnis marinus TaxID=3034023 RepID=A0ABD5ZKU1_9EURY|nr:dipeptide epimerase [Halosegnis sp. DT85]
MNAAVERVTLDLAEPFGIARGTQTTAENVVVELTHEGLTGVGAAAPSAHYGETPDTVEAVLPDLLDALPEDPHDLDAAHAAMDEVVAGNAAAKAAVDIALHDLVSELHGLPLYRYLGLDASETPVSSFTVGLADTDEMARKAREAAAAGHSVLKVKLGTDRDLDIVEAVTDAAPDARLRVDANEAWTPAEAIRKCEALAGRVEFVEQPVAASNPAGARRAFEASPVPIAADESLVTASDVPGAARVADIANVKLMKCGGVRPAVEAFHAARAHGMETMLGCMVESNAAIAAGVHLAPLLDYADLDGSLLLAEGSDPFAGPPVPELDPTDTATGTGAHRR